MLWETVFKIYSVKGQEQQSNKEKVEMSGEEDPELPGFLFVGI